MSYVYMINSPTGSYLVATRVYLCGQLVRFIHILFLVYICY